MAAAAAASSVALLVVLVVYAAAGAFAATTHIVGDNQSWDIPSSASYYTDWASKQKFGVGDSLVFNFATNAHDVLQVTKSSYDGCNKQGPLATYTTGPATVTLNTSGAQYFICAVGAHCSAGNQKMTLTVSAASSPTTPSSAPPPTSGAPTTPGTADPPSSSTTPPPPPPASAAPPAGLLKAAIATVALTASAAALLL